MSPVLVLALLGWPAARLCAQSAVTPSQTANGSVSGKVTDPDGNSIAAAKVTLSQAGLPELKGVSDDTGGFRFPGLAAGVYTLTITADGFAAQTRPFTLGDGEQQEIGEVQLRVAGGDIAVDAISQHDMAEQQVKQEEQQRLFAVLPNFFVSYDVNAVPLDPQQKFELTLRTVVDPTSFVITGIIAGVQQANDSYSGYNEGSLGYGKRYAAVYGNFLIGNLLGGAVLPAIFRQDPRYFYLGRGSKKTRAWYAIKMSVIARGDNGKWQPAYASILGEFAAGAISNTYYPTANRDGVGLTIENGSLNIVGNAIGNLVQEFFLKRVTTKTPKLNNP